MLVFCQAGILLLGVKRVSCIDDSFAIFVFVVLYNKILLRSYSVSSVNAGEAMVSSPGFVSATSSNSHLVRTTMMSPSTLMTLSV